MTFEQFIQEAIKMGLNLEQIFGLGRDLQLNTLRNLLIAKGIFAEQEFDELIGLEFKRNLEMLKQLPKNKLPGSH